MYCNKLFWRISLHLTTFKPFVDVHFSYKCKCQNSNDWNHWKTINFKLISSLNNKIKFCWANQSSSFQCTQGNNYMEYWKLQTNLNFVEGCNKMHWGRGDKHRSAYKCNERRNEEAKAEPQYSHREIQKDNKTSHEFYERKSHQKYHWRVPLPADSKNVTLFSTQKWISHTLLSANTWAKIEFFSIFYRLSLMLAWGFSEMCPK